jgi:hypothetical protein
MPFKSLTDGSISVRRMSRLLRFMRKPLCVSGAAALLALVGAAAESHAEVIHFRMTGLVTVDYQRGALPYGIYEGAPFVADLSYDSATPDPYYPEDPQRGYYLAEVGPNNFLRFRAGPAEVSARDVWLLVGNDIEGYAQPGDGRPISDLPGDSFQLQSEIIANFPIPTFHKIEFSWRDPDGLAFNSDRLPVRLSLNDFDDTWIRISTGSLSPRVDQFTIRGIVSEITRVPEPAAVPAAVLVLILLNEFTRRRRAR